MTKNIDLINTAVEMILKAVIFAAQFSGRVRKRSLKRLSKMEVDEKDKEILFLRDKVNQQQLQINILQKGLQKKNTNKRYTLREKLFILWYMEAFQVPRRRVTEHLGIAKSTLYRWLHKIQDQANSRIPANKTLMEIALLVWEITKANVSWGRVRIANQLALLKIFISGSTVRNILNRPQLPKLRGAKSKAHITEDKQPRSIPAWYPNHVWSIDTTMVFCWGMWPIHICVVIDHYSRKVMAAVPLEGLNAGWINNALEGAIEKYGPPKHIISDQGGVFIGEVFAELLDTYEILHRFGAIGKHGSIAVTERVNKTLKYEWLKRVAIIKGIDHLTELCKEFELWYNRWRPHMTLDGIRPDDVYYDRKPAKPKRDAKTVPINIEQHYFHQTRITGYRLRKVA
ncbi:MAG: DDE-type integrase/transposase/recombinase [Planctomycetes bacterium]|nr:DDE-type integrase/transposase/recombinase [Planctomycetota bacterium]